MQSFKYNQPQQGFIRGFPIQQHRQFVPQPIYGMQQTQRYVQQNFYIPAQQQQQQQQQHQHMLLQQQQHQHQLMVRQQQQQQQQQWAIWQQQRHNAMLQQQNWGMLQPPQQMQPQAAWHQGHPQMVQAPRVQAPVGFGQPPAPMTGPVINNFGTFAGNSVSTPVDLTSESVQTSSSEEASSDSSPAFIDLTSEDEIFVTSLFDFEAAGEEVKETPAEPEKRPAFGPPTENSSRFRDYNALKGRRFGRKSEDLKAAERCAEAQGISPEYYLKVLQVEFTTKKEDDGAPGSSSDGAAQALLNQVTGGRRPARPRARAPAPRQKKVGVPKQAKVPAKAPAKRKRQTSEPAVETPEVPSAPVLGDAELNTLLQGEPEEETWVSNGLNVEEPPSPIEEAPELPSAPVSGEAELDDLFDGEPDEDMWDSNAIEEAPMGDEDISYLEDLLAA